MSFWLPELVNTLDSGGLVAYPTEAIWGIGCDPFNELAVRKIIKAKERSANKGLIILVNEQAAELLFAEQDPEIKERCFSRWPGPVTWLIPNNGFFSSSVVGEHPTVAVRLSAHPITRQVVDAAGGFVVSTSANISGKRAAKYWWQMPQILREQLDFIVPGRCGNATQPSTIIDAQSGKIIRP